MPARRAPSAPEPRVEAVPLPLDQPAPALPVEAAEPAPTPTPRKTTQSGRLADCPDDYWRRGFDYWWVERGWWG